MSDTFDFQPVIIIGAARSGTNMLRDCLSSLKGVNTWPCDEINYIWRYGHASYPTDELMPSMLNLKIRKYIRRVFIHLANKHQSHIVLEKTCANILRIPYIHEIIPEAKFIYILRDGRDAAVSASLRWKAPLDIPYLYQKAKYVPTSDLLYYGSRYFMNRIRKVVSSKKRLSVWGPCFEGMHDVFQDNELYIACALQWLRCVEAAGAAFAGMPSEKVYQVKYENFVSSPDSELKAVLSVIGMDDIDDHAIASVLSDIRDGSVGKWRAALDEEQQSLITSVLSQSLERYGYEVNA